MVIKMTYSDRSDYPFHYNSFNWEYTLFPTKPRIIELSEKNFKNFNGFEPVRLVSDP